MTRLEEIRERWAAATPGPWEQGHHWDETWVTGGTRGRKFRPASDTSREWVPSPEDATAIAHAPADIAVLTGAIEGVLALHYEGEDLEEVLPQGCIDGPCEHDDDLCPEVTIKPCMECSIPGEYYVEWPCPTVKAITAALESTP